MKKVFSLALLMVLALSVASFAAAKTASAPVPVQSSNGDAWSGKMAVGTIAGIPSFIYHFNKDVTASIGGSYFTAAGGSATTLLGKVDYVLATMGSVQTTVGGYLNTVSGSGVASTTVFGGTCGVRTLVQPNLSLGMDIVIANSSTTGGATTTGIFPGTFVNIGYYF